MIPFHWQHSLLNDPPMDAASLITQVLIGTVSSALRCLLTAYHLSSHDTSTAESSARVLSLYLADVQRTTCLHQDLSQPSGREVEQDGFSPGEAGLPLYFRMQSAKLSTIVECEHLPFAEGLVLE
jgi:hypothetical protein